MRGQLHIHLDAIKANFMALSALCNGQASAVVKANGYGLGARAVVKALRPLTDIFFVATPDEALEIADLAQGATIYDLSGLCVFEQNRPAHIHPIINSMAQFYALGTQDYGLQFNTGMNRLGLDHIPEITHHPKLIMSHLACADEPNHTQNTAQLEKFRSIAMRFPNALKSLSATDGINLGKAYHFDLVRLGIGLYGGRVFEGGADVVQLSLPIIQIRDINKGETIGYGATYRAQRKMRVATLLGGYADGLLRAGSNHISLSHNGVPCPQIGRVSMDTITVDISAIDGEPESLDLITSNADLIQIAHNSQTIPYEILTSLGHRYERIYHG